MTLFSRQQNQRRPGFFWQGVLIMLPVTVLAIVSFISLRRDEQAAEQDARTKAAENVQSLARAVRLTVDDELHRYFTLQNVWMIGLRLAGQPSVAGAFPDEKLRADINKWEQAYPGFKLADLAAPQGELLADGRQIEPPEIPAAPTPPKWFRELSPEQAALWQALREVQSATNNPASIQAASETFLAANPSADARQAAVYLLRPSEQLLGGIRRLSMESGISFQDTACYRLLRARNASLSNSLLDSVWHQIFESPSFVAPTLLELAEGLGNRDDAAVQDKVHWMRQFWNGQSRVREWLVPLRRLPELNHWDPPKYWSCWTDTEQNGALAVFEPVTFKSMGSDLEGIAFSGRGYTIWFVPRSVVEAIFARALAENRFLIPAYAAATLTVDGMPLPRGNGERSAAEGSLLGSATQKFGKYFAADAVNFELRFYLTSREQMLSTERRRARLFGALILGTALTALAGLIAAWRAFRQQLQLNEQKSNFVSSVSHELRAPIASVRLMAESLEQGKIQEPTRQQEYFRFISQECRRLSGLIENVLDFSRIEQGRKQYEFEPTDLVALARETVRLMETYAAEKDIHFILKLDDPKPGTRNPEPEVDGRAIQQALVNLIDNAVKHSRHGETVTVGFAVGGQETEVRSQKSGEQGSGVGPLSSSQHPVSGITLWVEDHGPGIPPEEQERIFERFYRRGSELRRETQGVGIGLSIVKHIVEAHGGRIHIRSTVGQGSRFTIELPVSRMENREP